MPTIYETAYHTILSQSNYWRLFVDGRNQKADDVGTKQEYEYGYLLWAIREPHGLHMMRTAAQTFLGGDALSTPLSYELISDINASCFAKMDNLIIEGMPTIAIGDRGFGEWPMSKAQAVKSHITQKYSTFLSDLKLNPSHFPWGVAGGNIVAFWDNATIRSHFPKIATSYEQKLLKCTSDESKISLIAETAQTLELLHIFKDGNARTVITIWLNKELMRAGLQPAVIENPNDFDWKTTKELVDIIKVGQKAFTKLAISGRPYDTSLSAEAVDKNIESLYDSHISQLSAEKKTSKFIDLLHHNIPLPQEAIDQGAKGITSLGINEVVSREMIRGLSLAIGSGCCGGKETLESIVAYVMPMVLKVYEIEGAYEKEIICGLGIFYQYCESKDINLKTMPLYSALQEYIGFLSKIHDAVAKFEASNYFLEGKLPVMFLSAETCHLNGDEYMQKLSEGAPVALQMWKAFSAEVPAEIPCAGEVAE